MIGTGGKVIREIVEKTGAKINIEDDGTVKIASVRRQGDRGRHQVDQVDHRRAGSRRRSTRARSSRPSISAPSSTSSAPRTASSTSRQLADERVNKTTDVVKEGDKVWVKLLGFDERGKVRLSMKVVDQATGKEIARDKKDGRRRKRRLNGLTNRIETGAAYVAPVFVSSSIQEIGQWPLSR